MASITSDDEIWTENSTISDLNTTHSPLTDEQSMIFDRGSPAESDYSFRSSRNIVINLQNRELYGRFTKGRTAKPKIEPDYSEISLIHSFPLSELIKGLKDLESQYHIYMGFTMCGQYVLSYTQKENVTTSDVSTSLPLVTFEYDLYIWRFHPYKTFQFVSKHRLFNYLRGPYQLDRILFMQFPNDVHKIVCYGNQIDEVFHISIITLPSSTNCFHCLGTTLSSAGDTLQRGWCKKHGFEVHYMLPTNQPAQIFDPKFSLSFPNHLVINTGHHIHILNITTSDPVDTWYKDTLSNMKIPQNLSKNSICNDTFSDISESASDNFCSNSIVDAILDDFSEYELDCTETSKPFHELNISCEPLNVTGKSYHNTLVQNIFDPRIKRLQTNVRDYVFSVPHTSNQKAPEKSKVIDKKVAEKEYEFTEENEKYEKISLFRKKRLADKKYEFSEDNTENIVPLHILRRERRFFYRSQSRSIRSSDLNHSLFISPRSPGWRSPLQSPSSRHGQLSPGGARHIYCTTVRNSPYHSKSPISPRDLARKVSVYSPSLDGDCSDSESRLILNTVGSVSDVRMFDPKKEQYKWIKKIVRRYSNGDFETSSLVSGQSRDDFSNPIEIPSFVQSFTEPFEIVPDYKADHTTERQIIVSQRSMDCEQFVQTWAQMLCFENDLLFLHCEDYDIRVLCVCPISGEILCRAEIKIGASPKKQSFIKVVPYWANFPFTWNIATDAFDVVDLKTIQLFSDKSSASKSELSSIPSFHCQDVWVLSCDMSQPSLEYLRDYRNNIEICLRGGNDSWPGIWLHSDMSD